MVGSGAIFMSLGLFGRRFSGMIMAYDSFR